MAQECGSCGGSVTNMEMVTRTVASYGDGKTIMTNDGRVLKLKLGEHQLIPKIDADAYERYFDA